MLNDRTYTILKYIALVALPALAAFIGTMGQALGWQHTELTITFVTALDTLLGTLLGVSTRQYNKNKDNE